jgi:anhydro-N-acetylmuramic acid kinase
MNKSVKQLFEIANKDSRVIIGLMSGTSLDGLDLALCQIKHTGVNTKVELIAFETLPYSTNFKQKLKRISFKVENNLEQIALINKEIGVLHAQMVNQFLIKHQFKNEDVDLIASHGQTIFHSPQKVRFNDDIGNVTLQIGDADQIAVNTQIITVSDFRQKNIAEGKEGAPLVIYGDYLLFKSDTENRILLNIGGISNFTIIPQNASFNDVLSSDCGPGNTLMDQYIHQQNPNLFYDEDAKIALSGTVNHDLLLELTNHPFFEQSFPKSTGPELFNLAYLNNAMIKSDTLNLSPNDVMATLNWFTAQTIATGIMSNSDQQTDFTLYCSGGGIHNLLLIKNLQTLLPNVKIEAFETIGFNPDAKEAALFAVLANETIAGDYSVFTPETLSMGKISFPF